MQTPRPIVTIDKIGIPAASLKSIARPTLDPAPADEVPRNPRPGLRNVGSASAWAVALFASTIAAAEPPAYPDHNRLLVIRDAAGRETPIRSITDWEVRRAHILANFERVAGPLPGGDRRVALDVQIIETHPEPRYIRKKVRFAVEPGDRVPAWLLIPKGSAERRPGMLCLHQTISIGKDEPAGLGPDPELAYARELAERGYVCVVPDYPNFGEYKVDPYALGYASATMKGIWNHLRAVDLLAGLPEVDPDRLGAIGHSLGGHNAIFAALYDPRIKAVVSSCGFCNFTHYYGGNPAGWSHKGYMPLLKSRFKLDLRQIPFDFSELVAALAPRAFFTNSPLHDANFEVAGVRTALTAARPVYELFHVPGNLVAIHPDAAHSFPAESRKAAYEFLVKQFAPPKSAALKQRD